MKNKLVNNSHVSIIENVINERISFVILILIENMYKYQWFVIY